MFTYERKILFAETLKMVAVQKTLLRTISCILFEHFFALELGRRGSR